MSNKYTISCNSYKKIYNDCIKLFDKNECLIYLRFLQHQCDFTSNK